LVATSTAIIYGNLTIASGMTLTASANAMTFGATSGPKTITTSAKTLDFPLTFNGVGGSWQLQDALTMGTTRTLTHTNGTIDLNGKNLTIGTSYTTAAGTKNLTFNLGTLVCPVAGATAFNNAAPAGFTTTEGTPDTIGLSPKISMSAATAQTFVGGGSAFNCYINNDGAKTLTISGNNTFKGTYNLGIGLVTTLALTGNNSFGTIETLATGATINLLLTAGSTQTFTTSFGLRGDASASCAINTTVAGSKATINKTFSGIGGKGLYVFFDTVTLSDYLVVRDIDFTPAPATNGSTPYGWYLGANSTNSGNNSGAAFVAYPQVVYQITNPATTSWTVPSDFNPSNNALYLIGAGGGGAGSLNATNHWNGGGGGGGGYAGATNVLISGGSSITVAVGNGGAGGAVGSNGTAGVTTVFGSYSAGGGGGGTTGTAGALAGGAGGVGTTYTGGRGGGVSQGSAVQGVGGAGGGGSAGPFGNGGAGGYNTSPSSNNAGAGGGGNGGGVAGGNAVSASPGAGGNGYLGTGGGGTTTATSTGTNGGGGGGTYVGGLPGFGSTGLEILKTVGSAGGGGGYTSGTAATARAGVDYGAGGSGAAVSSAGVTSAGGTGGNGLIVITYTPRTATGNFFFMF